MSSLNRVEIIGNLGKDPQMEYMPDGTPRTRFTVATTRKWTSTDGQEREETTWFNIVAFRKLAETCNEYLAKGKQVYVAGRLRDTEYTDKDNIKRRWVEVVAETMLMLGKRESTDREGARGGYPSDDMGIEDVPF